MALVKALLPFGRLRKISNPVLTGLAESWIGVNSWMLDRFLRTRVHVQEDVALQKDGHYLVLANHQSWVDIVVLQKVFNRRIPLLRFFLKRQLFWVPLLGLAWIEPAERVSARMTVAREPCARCGRRPTGRQA